MKNIVILLEFEHTGKYYCLGIGVGVEENHR